MIASTQHLPMWRPKVGKLPISVLLSDVSLEAAVPTAIRDAGFEVSTVEISRDSPVTLDNVRQAAAVILEVELADPLSTSRFEEFRGKFPDVPTIAATSNLTVSAVRTLMRMGAADVLSLPLHALEVEQALERLHHDLAAESATKRPAGKIVSIIGSAGGIGTTSLLTQLASIEADTARKAGKASCLLDLDIQFGNAGLYLGGLPSLTIKDVLEAGARADGALLRSTATLHPSGLHYVAAPPQIMPLESINPDLILALLDLAAEEFNTVFIDLPKNWTNWSLSALARSDLILVVVELSVASLHQARRQIDMIKQQGIAEAPIRVIVNRVENKLFRTIDLSDVQRTLGQQVKFTVAEDDQAFRTALDQGVTLAEASVRSRATKDLKKIAVAISETLAEAR